MSSPAIRQVTDHPLKAALYARGADALATAAQVRELRQEARTLGWVIAGVFVDQCQPHDPKPDLDKMMKAVRSGSVNIVAVTSLDRLGSTMRNIVLFIDHLVARGVEVVAVEDGLDSTTAEGAATLRGMLLVAGADKKLARERGRQAVAGARRRGIPVGRPRAVVDMDEALKLRAEGQSIRGISRRLGVGATTVQRAFDAAGA